MAVFLEANGPLDLAYTLETGQAFRWQPESGWWYGVVGENVWKVRGVEGGLEIESSPQPAEEVALQARRYFRLDDDLPAIYRRLGADERVAAAIQQYGGLRLVRQDPWECLVSFIISAFSNVRRITGHIKEISRLYGIPVLMDGRAFHTFPGPGVFSSLGEDDFRKLGLGYRSRFLARLSREVEAQKIDFASLMRSPYGEAKSSLLRVYGVGDKVADCVLLFSLDKLEACPIDVWVRRALTEWYFPGQKVTDRQLRLWVAERFGQDAGYAQQYLFHKRRMDGRSLPANATTA